MKMCAKYIGQCDFLRRGNAENELKWRRMVALAKPTTTRVFIRNVDLNPLLDEDESPEDYLGLLKKQEHQMGLFRSKWGDREAWFIQTSGFEFIFTL